jgi:hypothetical protein
MLDKAAITSPKEKVTTATLVFPEDQTTNAASRLPKINKHSAKRNIANATGRRNNSAKFFVQPSFIWDQLRYMRVRTASPP